MSMPAAGNWSLWFLQSGLAKGMHKEWNIRGEEEGTLFFVQPSECSYNMTVYYVVSVHQKTVHLNNLQCRQQQFLQFQAA